MMFGEKRRYQIHDVASADELAETLTQHDWCGCAGFRLGDLLFLNDSSGGDGAQEYGVFRNGRQIETITFGWCTREKALGYIERLLAGDGCEPWADLPRIDHPAGPCTWCA